MEHKYGIAYPCAACKVQRKKCGEECLLAPYFPPHDPHKFCIAHRVFGANNILKLLRDVRVESREDAVSSMVYEATARVLDPVYGCAGTVCQLQQQVLSLQSQLATTQADLLNTQACLFSLITGIYSAGEAGQTFHEENSCHTLNPIVSEDVDQADPFGLWDCLN